MKIISVCVFVLIVAAQIEPCTIISGVDENAMVWAGNNEDYVFDFETYLNVLPGDKKLWSNHIHL